VWGWNQLEADFFVYYRLDLFDAIYKEVISIRRFMALVSGLPVDSAFFRFMQDKDSYSLPSILT